MALDLDDHVAIQQLVARYNHAIDSGDGAAYADAFVDDGVLDAGGLVVEGRDALHSFAETFAASVWAPRHVATNLVIDGQGDRAELRAYVQLYSMEGDPGRQGVRASGIYHDTLVKQDGRWRFVRRTYTGDESAPQP
ncbi:MAG: nuclear transport factor 2 family protein [Acidimicrobiales bacterium]|nr:nuclear transport factor 2 family protein [Acidimicrobiales bacterium]